MDDQKYKQRFMLFKEKTDYAVEQENLTSVKDICAYTGYGINRTRNYLKVKYPHLIQSRAPQKNYTVGNLEDFLYRSEHELAKAIEREFINEKDLPPSLTTIKNHIKAAVKRLDKEHRAQNIIYIHKKSPNEIPIILYEVQSE